MSPPPRDDDEDIAPRRPGTRPGNPAAAPAPPRAASTLNWGFVGKMHRIEALVKFPGQTGVVRLLANTIKYERPPVEIGWVEVKDQKGRFEMAWPGNPVSSRTLEDVGVDARMARGKGFLPPNHPVLKELDEAIFSLVNLADKLTRAGWGLGLIAPAGVMLNITPDAVSAVPVDLGFTWIGEFGDPPWDHSPGKPAWLADDPVDNPTSALWEQSPVEQQFAGPGKKPVPDAPPGSDVRTLARLIAAVLTGKPSQRLAHEPGAVWGVLIPAAAGDIHSMRDFLAELTESPPSTHFTAPPKPIQVLAEPSEAKKKSSKGLVFGAIAGLLLLAGAAGLYFGFLNKEKDKTPVAAIDPGPKPPPVKPPDPIPIPPPVKPPDPVPKPPQPEPAPLPRPPSKPPDLGPKTADLDKASKDFDAAKDLADKFGKFRGLANAAKGSKDQNAATRVGAARQKLFAEWVGTCEAKLDESASAAKRGVAGHDLRKLTNEYAAIHKDFPPTDPNQFTKEQQWLEQYDRQAELLGWPR